MPPIGLPEGDLQMLVGVGIGHLVVVVVDVVVGGLEVVVAPVAGAVVVGLQGTVITVVVGGLLGLELLGGCWTLKPPLEQPPRGLLPQ